MRATGTLLDINGSTRTMLVYFEPLGVENIENVETCACTLGFLGSHGVLLEAPKVGAAMIHFTRWTRRPLHITLSCVKTYFVVLQHNGEAVEAHFVLYLW